MISWFFHFITVENTTIKGLLSYWVDIKIDIKAAHYRDRRWYVFSGYVMERSWKNDVLCDGKEYMVRMVK